ncbi:MAG: hypothetical protein RIQ96_1516 [Pseudomonadota bacterium]
MPPSESSDAPVATQASGRGTPANAVASTALRPTLWNRAAFRALFPFAVLTAAAVAGLQMFERTLLRQVQDGTEVANMTLTRVFVNDAWDRLRPDLDLQGKLSNPRDNPALRDVDAVVRNFAKGTDLVKVKIYSLSGMTLYSSDPAQVGENKANNAGFQAAARGRLASELTYRGKFGGFDGELYERNLVSSYVPVRSAQGVEAVVELYTDRTVAIEATERMRLTAYAYAGGMVVVGFALLWWVVRPPRRPAAGASAALLAPGAAAGASADTADPTRPWREALHTLREPAQRLGEAALAHRLAPPDAQAWERMVGGLRQVSRQLGELALLDELRQAAGTPLAPQAPQRRWSEVLGRSVASFVQQADHAGVTVEPHVEPRLGGVATEHAATLEQMLSLMLDVAAQATGAGRLRLNIQPLEKGGVQIEVVGARTPGAATPAAAAASEAMRASALEAIALLAAQLDGRLERASQAAAGPWLTVALGHAG